MGNRFQAALAAALLTAASAASGQGLTEAQARTLIAPWYGLFNEPVAGDAVKSVHEQLLAPDYQSCWGVLPGDCWGRDQSMKVVGNFAKSIPDMKFRHQGGDGGREPGDRARRGLRHALRRPVRRTPYGQEFSHPGDRHPDDQGRKNRTDLPPRKLAERSGATTGQAIGSTPLALWAPL